MGSSTTSAGGMGALVRDGVDRLVIHELLYRYCRAVDEADRDTFLTCFSEHATWRSRNPSTRAVEVWGTGRPEIGAAFDAIVRGGAPDATPKGEDKDYRRPPGQCYQMTLNPIVALHGDHATCCAYFMCVLSSLVPAGPSAEVLYAGQYRDRLVRDPDHAWRFADRLIITGPPASIDTTERVGHAGGPAPSARAGSPT